MTKNRPSSRSAKRQRAAGKVPPFANRPPISAVIFDLDDTLYDCLNQRVKAAHRNASRAMRQAGVPATVNAIFRERMRAFNTDPQLHYIDATVCRKFGVNHGDLKNISDIARHAYFLTPVSKLSLFPGAATLLRSLKKRGVRNFIVSYGDPGTQRAKVKALKLDREPAVEKIYFADRDKVRTKEQIFNEIVSKTGLPASEFLVVGDRAASEIAAGKKLGMHTVRLRRGEFVRLEPAGAHEQSDFEIKRIASVWKLPFSFGTAS